MKTLKLKVGGMHCGGCAERLQALLGLQQGVREAAVSFREKDCQITFNPAAVDEGRLVEIVTQAGFTAEQM